MKRYLVWSLPILTAGCVDITGAGRVCTYEQDFRETISTLDMDRVRILAEAGDLRVEGHSGLNEVRVRGTGCAADARDLEDIELVVQRSGSAVRIVTLVPTGSSINAHLDLVVEVPDWMLAEIQHEDGDIEVYDVSGVDIYDNSGNIKVDNIYGDVDINDDSGDISATNIAGDLYMWDASGGIDVRYVGGEVLVEADGSGNLILRNVTTDIYIMEDGSGDIVVENVGGDFTVDYDSSGSISYRNVRGRVLIP
jgi:hypothetical protein